MKRFGSVSVAIFAVLFVILATERRALASGYVDPGSGLLALQAITSVGVATLYYLRRRIRGWFGPKAEKSHVGQVVARPNNPKNPA